jgi:hypothetical protein
MKITLAIGPFFPVPAVLGSALEKIQLALAEEMVRLGHSVTVISRTYGDFPREEITKGVRHLRAPSWDAPRSRLLFRLYDLFYSVRVARVHQFLARRIRMDIAPSSGSERSSTRSSTSSERRQSVS